MVALAHPLLEIVAVECGNGLLELRRGHEQRRCAFIEERARRGILRRIPRQRQVVRGVGPGAGEAEALDGFGDAIGQPHVGGNSGARLQARLHHVDAPRDAGRIAPVQRDRIKAVQSQVPVQPPLAALLGDLAALFDAAPVEDDDRADQSAVLGAPPAWRPVAATLFLERTVAEEGDQAFILERRMHVLQLGKAEIAAFHHAPGGVRIDVGAEGRRRRSVRIEGVGIEVAYEPAQPFAGAVVTFGVPVGHVANQHVQRVDGGHAVPLAHHPRAGDAIQGIHQQVAGVGGHHVEGPAGVAFRRGLEIIDLQGRAVGTNALAVGHVRHQPHAGAGDAVGRGEPLPCGAGIRRAAQGDQLVHHLADPELGKRVMSDHPVAGRPVGERGIGLPVGVGEFKDPLALGGRQLVGGAAVEMQVHGSSGESVEAVIRVDAAAARSAPSAMALEGWEMVSVLTMRARPASCRRA